jgi:hypothetical protein
MPDFQSQMKPDLMEEILTAYLQVDNILGSMSDDRLDRIITHLSIAYTELETALDLAQGELTNPTS